MAIPISFAFLSGKIQEEEKVTVKEVLPVVNRILGADREVLLKPAEANGCNTFEDTAEGAVERTVTELVYSILDEKVFIQN